MFPFHPLRLVAVLLIPLLCGAPAEAAPNLIFILADDMGVGEVAHGGGRVPTPNIDRLAREGLRFTDAHTTSSVCTPTRYGIMTGRYNWRSPLKASVLSGTSEPLIPPSRVTIARFLQDRGYQTGVVGKWHLGLKWTLQDPPPAIAAAKGKEPGWNIDYTRRVGGGPCDLGFTHDFLYPASLDMPPYVYLRDDLPVGVPTVTKAFLVPNRPGPALADFEADQCLTHFAREARAFIAASAAAKKPFFLYLPLTSPHTPIIPSAKWRGQSALGPYGDFLMETDWVVGEILSELAAQNADQDTLLVFTADNGTSPQADIPALEAKGHKPNGAWRGHKADIFEGGHRVPFLVRWPALVKGGQTCAQTVCTADFFATAADVLGESAAIPAGAAEDSFSLLPLLKNPAQAEAVRPFTIHHSINGSFAIRRGDWKLCLCPDSGGWSEPKPPAGKGQGKAKARTSGTALPPVQLFHLGEDPAERNNLAETKPELVDELAALLETAIRNGRTTPGPKQANEGWPNTFPAVVLERLPGLREGGQ
jgi:arylsulfatase A